MQTLLSKYQEITGNIITAFEEVPKNETALSIGKFDTDIYFSKLKLLSTFYSDHEKSMKEKIKEPEKRITIPDVFSTVQENRI